MQIKKVVPTSRDDLTHNSLKPYIYLPDNRAATTLHISNLFPLPGTIFCCH
jgi:hypothetical protein